MKITLEKIDDCNGKLVIDIEEAEENARIERRLKHYV